MKSRIFVSLTFVALLFAGFGILVAQTSTKQTTKQTVKTETTTKDEKPKSPEHVAKRQSKEMQTKLDLTADQTSQIENIYLTNLKDKNKNPEADPKLMHKQTHDDVMKVLTPEQQKKLKELQAEKKKEKK